MNALDNLLLIIFVAVLLFYCYKKKKLPFSKLRKGAEQNENTGTAQNTAGSNNIVPMPAQNIGAFSQMYPYLYGIPTGTPKHATYCKLIPFTFYHVLDKDTESAQVNAFISHNVTDLETSLNNEIKILVSKGYTVTDVNAVSFIMNDSSAHLLYCIVYIQ